MEIIIKFMIISLWFCGQFACPDRILAVIGCSTIIINISSVHSFAGLTVIHIKGPNNNPAKEKKNSIFCHHYMCLELFVVIFNAVIPY